MEDKNTVLKLSPTKIYHFILFVIGILITLNLLALIGKFQFGHPNLLGLSRLVTLDLENNIPTWFSSILILSCSVLLFVCYWFRKAHEKNDKYYWGILSFLFLCLSIDEAASIHELLIVPIRNLLSTSGIFYYAWVLPGGCFVLALTCFFWKFVLSLPKATTINIFISAFIYLSGTIGMEMVSGLIRSINGETEETRSLIYELVVIVEESLEMVGMAFFMYTILVYLASIKTSLQFQVDRRSKGNRKLICFQGMLSIVYTVFISNLKIPILFGIWILISTGCGTPSNHILPEDEIAEAFKQTAFETKIPFATPEMLRVHESNLNKEYVIGPGDKIRIDFWGRENLSGDHLVGPFGKITLPMLGEFNLGGLTRVQSINNITQLYQRFYDSPILTVKIVQYLNNKVYVLGRVTNPGVIHFDGNGSLLEALSLAGGLPTRDKTIFLSKCSIIRGNDQIIWVDLVQLLQKGNLKLNVKLRNNDIIHIPESTDAAVFVMGEVRNPGSYQIQTSGLSLLDAINLAGGTTEDGNVNEIRLIRNMEEGNVMVVDLMDFIERGDYTKNALLQDDDIIYVPQRGMAKFNYYLRQVDPLLRTFVSGALLKSSFSHSGD